MDDTDWKRVEEELRKHHIEDREMDISEMKPNLNNPRHHPEDQLRALEKDIRHFGPVVPMIVRPDGRIIAGHARYEVAKRLGMKSFPVRIYDWDDKDSDIFMIADNRVAEMADVDMVKLEKLLVDLREQEVDLSLTAYTDMDLERMLIGLDFSTPDFELGDSESFKEKKPIMAKCPKCGELFEVTRETRL
jgi:hypothetical protein